MKGREHVGDGASANASANGQEAIAHPEATIDQVRDLLFGGAHRSIENRLAGLQEETQASLKQLQAEFAKEVAAVQAKVLELERSTEKKQRASQREMQREIGAAISELGATISELGSGRTGK